MLVTVEFHHAIVTQSRHPNIGLSLASSRVSALWLESMGYLALTVEFGLCWLSTCVLRSEATPPVCPGGASAEKAVGMRDFRGLPFCHVVSVWDVVAASYFRTLEDKISLGLPVQFYVAGTVITISIIRHRKRSVVRQDTAIQVFADVSPQPKNKITWVPRYLPA